MSNIRLQRRALCAAAEPGRWTYTPNDQTSKNAICCFCTKSVPMRSAWVIVIYVNLNETNCSQNLYTHSNCLKNHLAIPVPLIFEVADDAESIDDRIT